MGLLDDLEKQAQEKKQLDELEARKLQEQQSYYRRVTEPRMSELHHYLEKLLDNLNYLKPEAQYELDLPVAGKKLFEPSYDFSLHTERRHWEVILEIHGSMVLRLNKAESIDILGEKHVKNFIQTLHSLHLASQVHRRKNARGEVVSARFKPHGKLHFTIRLTASPEDPYLHIHMENFDAIGIHSKRYPVEKLSEQWLDNFGRFLIGQHNSLLQESLPDEMRHELQKKLIRENKAKREDILRWQMEHSELLLETEEKEKKGLLSKLFTKTD